MLLDAASLYFRAFYGVPTSVTSPDGRPVIAVQISARKPSNRWPIERVIKASDGGRRVVIVAEDPADARGR